MTPLFPLEAMLVLRFFKLLAVAALASGTIGAFVPRALEDRQRFAYAVAGPGFGATWVIGFATAFGGSVSFLAAWIIGAVLLSLFSINVVLWSVGKEGRRSTRAGALAVLSLAACIALMVWKPTL